MKILKKLFGNDDTNQDILMEAEKNTVYAPLSGTVIPLKEIEDAVFSAGIIGQGCGIHPSDKTIYSPFDGIIKLVADTKHAVGITSSDGIELLIHVGIDTVTMNGRGFQVHVKTGDAVKCGQKLLTFSRDEILKAGFSDTIAVLITNSDDYKTFEFCQYGKISSLEKLLTVR